MQNQKFKTAKQLRFLVALVALLMTVSYRASADDGQLVDDPAATAPKVKAHKHHLDHHLHNHMHPAVVSDAHVTVESAAPTKLSSRVAAPVQPADVPTKTISRVSSVVDQAPAAPSKYAARVSAPVEQAPAAPSKYAARVSAPVEQAPAAPTKYASRVSAPVEEQPVAAPAKFASRVSAPVAPAAQVSANVEAPVQIDPAASIPTKYGSRVAAPVAAAPEVTPEVAVDPSTKLAARVSAPVAAPSQAPAIDPAASIPSKYGSRVAAPVVEAPQPAPASVQIDPAASIPSKYGSRVAAPVQPVASQEPVTAAPPAEAAPNLMQQPQAPSKFASRVAAPSEPVAPSKFASRVAAPVSSAIPDQSLRQEISLPTAASPTACQPAIEPRTGVQQATALRDTLNQRLAQNGPVSKKNTMIWTKDDDIDDSDAMVKELGKGEKRPHVRTEVEKSTTLSPFVKKLLEYSSKEASRTCRTLKSGRLCIAGNHSKRACLQGVRMAFQEAAGQSTKAGWTSNAKDAGPFIAKYGYHKVSPKDLKPENAPVGSVMIYDNPENPRHPGHIETKGLNGYYSDFFESHPVSESKNIKRRLIAIWVPPTT